MVLSPFLSDEVVKFSSQCLISSEYWLLPCGGDGRGVWVLTPSVRWTSPPNATMKIGMRIEQLNRRIWGRLGDGLLFAKMTNGLGSDVHETALCFILF